MLGLRPLFFIPSLTPKFPLPWPQPLMSMFGMTRSVHRCSGHMMVHTGFLDAGEKTFLIDKNGKPYRVSVDRLKPATLSPTPSIAPGSSTPAPSTALTTSAPCPTPPVTSRPSATTSLQPASPSVPPQKITRSGRNSP